METNGNGNKLYGKIKIRMDVWIPIIGVIISAIIWAQNILGRVAQAEEEIKRVEVTNNAIYGKLDNIYNQLNDFSYGLPALHQRLKALETK